VVLKALAKDRGRRYESAGALAADVERYLADEPVEACPPSAAYRVRKFARRNWRLLTTAGAIAATLVAATAVSTWQAVKARDAEGRAVTEAAIARAVNDFLQIDLLGQTASPAAPGEVFRGQPFLTVKEALDRATARIGQRFQDQPLVEAAIRTTVGKAYKSLEDSQPGVPHLERAVALRTAHLGPDHPDSLDSMSSLAGAYFWIGRHADAIALRQHILKNHEARLGADHPETLTSLGALAGAYSGDGQWETSARILEELVGKQRAILGPTHTNTIDSMHNLAICYDYLDRLADALTMYEGIYEHRIISGPSGYFNLCYAYACQRAGQLDLAERLIREALVENRKHADSQKRRIGAANVHGWLARTLFLKGQYAAAEPLAKEAVAVFEQELPDNQRHFYWVSLLGAVLAGQQRYAEAEHLLLRGYEGMKQQEATLNGVERRRLAETGERVVRFYEMTMQPEKARAWQVKLAAAPDRP
jgi:tetratricopeptide (TPR) repeat protein